jgi:hypothetical protein
MCSLRSVSTSGERPSQPTPRRRHNTPIAEIIADELLVEGRVREVGRNASSQPAPRNVAHLLFRQAVWREPPILE